MEKFLRYIFVFLFSLLFSVSIFVIVMALTFGYLFKIAIITTIVSFVIFLLLVNFISKKLNIQCYKNVIIAFCCAILTQIIYYTFTNSMTNNSTTMTYEYTLALEPFIGLISAYVFSLIGIFMGKRAIKRLNKK